MIRILALLLLMSLSPSLHAKEKGTDALKYLPIQDAGRVKPYDTFARETLQLVWGKSHYEGKPAVDIVTTWLMAPQLWQGRKFVRVDHKGMKKALKIEGDRKYFSPDELIRNPRTDLVLRELGEMRRNNEKLTPYFQAVQRLENQLLTFHAVRMGALRVAPAPKGHPNGDAWLEINQLEGELRDKFIIVSRSFAAALSGQMTGSTNTPDADRMPASEGEESGGDSAAASEMDEDGEPKPTDKFKSAHGGGLLSTMAAAGSPGVSLKEALDDFKKVAQKSNPEVYPSEKKINTEVFYNGFHPFQWSWIIYLIGALLGLVAWQTSWKSMYVASFVAMFGGLIIHTYGMYLRVVLTGRPPVSNMYETVIWVAWGAVAFAMFFEWFRKKGYLLMAGGIVGVICMIVADNAPVMLDKSLQPLEPVLRSNMWLTVHVLTITLSYAPLFLASILGAVGLWYIIKGEGESSEKVKHMAQACYRNIQIGVVLLAAGTILGGVWADYSWGRFWGWDPKETWAFIALMGYLAVLHGRLVGWVRNFGMLAFSIITFNLVIMAWYGVNFVLGAGLHSYGFGAGGVEWVAGFCGIFFIYVVYAAFIHYFVGRKGKASA